MVHNKFMVATPDTRWKQRFENFKRAFLLLRDGIEPGVSNLSQLEREGIVQRFEYTFELAWKTLKDFLEAEGVVVTPSTPRQVLKEAFKAKILEDGQLWIDMLDHRNLLSHRYDGRSFDEASAAIEQQYLAALDALHLWLLERAVEES